MDHPDLINDFVTSVYEYEGHQFIPLQILFMFLGAVFKKNRHHMRNLKQFHEKFLLIDPDFSRTAFLPRFEELIVDKDGIWHREGAIRRDFFDIVLLQGPWHLFPMTEARIRYIREFYPGHPVLGIIRGCNRITAATASTSTTSRE